MIPRDDGGTLLFYVIAITAISGALWCWVQIAGAM